MPKKRAETLHIGSYVKAFIGIGGLSFLAWLILAKNPISLPGPIAIDPPTAWFEWAFPDSTPTGVVGIWFAEFAGDPDWSRRNALMDAFRLEMKIPSADKVDIKELQTVVKNHKQAQAIAARLNASIIVWGRVGKLSDEETLSVFQTIIPNIDQFNHEVGPLIVTGAPRGPQIRPEEAARQLKRGATLIAAYTAVVQNNYSRASDLYESLLSDFPTTKTEAINFHFFAGLSQQFLWEADKKKKTLLRTAKTHYEYVARNCRDYPSPAICANSRLNLGVLYLGSGDFKRAIQYHTDALFFAGEDRHQILKNLGVIYVQLGKYSDAEKVYREALVLAPNSPRGTLGLADVLMKEGKLKEAEIIFRRAIEISPKDHKPYFLLGECLIKDGQPNEGLSYQRRAAEIAPDKVFIRHP
jgi:tetratricopeptide (TPR) repeat protein